MKKGDLYIVIEEDDLCNIIKSTRNKGMELSHDVGLLCYNDSPIKEILIGGISVISTDFSKMGETAADFILQKKTERVKNPFYLIKRNSF